MPTSQAPSPITGLSSGEVSLFGSRASKLSVNDIGPSFTVILKHSPCITWILNVRIQSLGFISELEILRLLAKGEAASTLSTSCSLVSTR